jgi:hypothetical protein
MSNEIIEELMKVNPVYAENAQRWQFLYESYEGGVKYQQGNHLLRYANERQNAYGDRIKATPLDNHCASVISVYNSFLFRVEPERALPSLQGEDLVNFMRDTDMDGRNINQFMKDVATWASVYGHTYILLAKPNIGAVTLADEMENEVRPYANIISPLAMLDWNWTRMVNGKYVLSYIKYIDSKYGNIVTVKEWTDEVIITSTVDTENDALLGQEAEANDFGKIPVVLAYNKRSTDRGQGISDINDIADAQKYIYNLNSEIEQAIRLDAHPVLAKSKATKLGTGAGAILNFPEDMDEHEKPFFLETSGTNVSSILETIEKEVGAIDKMANTGAVRATESRTISGVAMETEFQLLNAKLSEKADNLELAEEQMWKLYAEYQGKTYNGVIEYPGSFNIRDLSNEINQLSTAAGATDNPAVKDVIDRKIAESFGEDPDQIPANGSNSGQDA